MPSKPTKAAKPKHASELRWGDKTAAEVKALADQVEAAGRRLSAIATRMENDGPKTVRMDSATKCDRGLALIQEFETALKIAAIKATDK